MDAMPKKVTESIRPATADDILGILPGWLEAYGDGFQYKYPHRWRWMFVDNPFVAEAEKNRLPAVVAVVEDNIAAWACAMETPVFLGGNTAAAAFTCNTFTLPEFRKLGLGGRIQDKIAEKYPILWSISMSSGNRRNKIRAGGVSGKPLYICCRRFRPLDDDALMASFLSVIGRRKATAAKWLGPFCRTRAVKSMMRALPRIALPASLPQTFSQSENTGDRFEMRKINSFGADWDHLWKNRIRSGYNFGVDRSAAYMNWKYVRQPHVSFQKTAILIDGRFVGIMVYRMAKPPEIPMGLVTEFLIDPEYRAVYFPQAVGRVTRDLHDQRALAVYWGTSDPRQLSALEKAGYRLIRINVPVVQMQDNLKKHWALTAGKPNARWLLSLGDHDQDQFSLGQQPSFSTLVHLLRGRVPGMEDMVDTSQTGGSDV